MKSSGPWNLRGLRPEAREAARTAARRSGMSVGEWLNNVIEPDEDDDDEPMLFAEGDDEAEHDRPRRSRNHPERERRRERPDRQRSERNDRDSDFDRDSARARHELGTVNSRLDRLSQQLERLSRADAAPRRPPAARRPSALGEGRDDGRLTGAPAQPRRPAERPSAPRSPANTADPANADNVSIDDAVAEIAARQRVLDGDAPLELSIQDKPAPAQPSHDQQAHNSRLILDHPEPPVLDIGGLDAQLRQITARIEALRPSGDLENSVEAIRTDLTEIAHLMTEALPRRAVESLEIEVKALAQRIEHSRQCGFDTAAVAGLERGLGEVREALRGLTPAENLIGFDEAIKALSQKVDMIVAKDDPAALQQLETAIGALRGIVSHVASNETLTKVAEDVRTLASKVDGLANSAASGAGLSAIEQRIDSLANALTASTEAGQAVPKELEKLLSGLIEKLEWVQLTHTDHAALAHLEDRIATLVQRFDTSDARLGHLEAVERGIADLLVHIEELRRGNGDRFVSRAAAAPNPIERDVAEIRQSEQRTRDSLEAVHGTVEHVVDRLAMIESGIRESGAPAAPAWEPPAPAFETKPRVFAAEPAPSVPEPAPEPVPQPMLQPMAAPAPATPPAIMPKTAQPPSAASREPIDPDLPPDHPLEPGSSRARPTASAAERIAASEAAVSSARPPVLADSGQKPNFIAAARRAAQAAAAAPPTAEPVAEKGPKSPKGPRAAAAFAVPAKGKQRTRPLIIAGAAALIVLGCLQIATRMFEPGGTPVTLPPEAQPQKAPPPISSLPEPEQPAPDLPAAAAPAPAPPASSAPPATLPVPQPKPNAIINTKPAKQSAAEPANVIAAVAAATDVTGSLPHAAASLGDKLPATIGGPALRAAALSGDAAAAYEVATRFADGHGVPRSNEEAALWFERAAKQGLAPAQFRLGSLNEKGLGVKKNLAAARDLYLAAAGKGNGKAMHNLAVLYAEGVDGPADYNNAAHWFREAADHGVMDSQYNLGILYARGVGVAQNYAESYKWFALAAIAGDQDAAKKSDEVASHLDQQSLAAAQLAVKTFTAAPQPDEAVNVKAPAGGWDATASAAPAKAKPMSIKPPAPTTKLN
jgi:localization factor PodJL